VVFYLPEIEKQGMENTRIRIRRSQNERLPASGNRAAPGELFPIEGVRQMKCMRRGTLIVLALCWLGIGNQNLYNIVQPQVQYASEISQLQQQASQFQGTLAQASGAGALVTGHPAFFGNYSHYYGRRVGGFGTSSLLGQGGMGGMMGGLRNPAMMGLQGMSGGFGSGGVAFPGAGGGVQ
jgi:hypothetical protein